jgi:hypothetical protein
MRNPPHEVRGARVGLDKSRGGDAVQFTRAPLSNQPRPLGPSERAAIEARIEQLAYGEVLPDDLTEIRRIWWSLARQGVRLPAQPGVLVITGGAT